MKKVVFLTMIVTSVLVASCGSEETEETQNGSTEKEQNETAQTYQYTLDTEASELKWRGEESEDDFHVGTIDFSEGNMMMEGSRVVGGTFVVDMSTITVTDDDMAEGKKAILKKHLEEPKFFDVAKYATTTVSLGEYSDGKLDITLNMMGQEITTSVPVEVGISEDEVTMNGNFTVDFSSLGLPGLKPKEEEDESISPKIQFGIRAVLTK